MRPKRLKSERASARATLHDLANACACWGAIAARAPFCTVRAATLDAWTIHAFAYLEAAVESPTGGAPVGPNTVAHYRWLVRKSGFRLSRDEKQWFADHGAPYGGIA